jgi:undecaprenyl phosphate-alpha-L-ara4N flippase subunit ArnE
MYIVKNFPFSMAYPMISISYVLGMFAAIFIFHEDVPLVRWIGAFLIMAGCVLVAK